MCTVYIYICHISIYVHMCVSYFGDAGSLAVAGPTRVMTSYVVVHIICICSYVVFGYAWTTVLVTINSGLL